MINPYLIFSLLFVTALLQSTLAPFLSVNNVHPNLILVWILAWSFRKDLPDTIVWTFLGGLILDMLSGTTFGIFTFSAILIAILASFWQSKHFGNNLLPILLVFPYSILFNLCVLIYIQLTGYTVPWGNILADIVFPESTLNVIAMALIFPLLVWLDKFEHQNDLTI